MSSDFRFIQKQTDSLQTFANGLGPFYTSDPVKPTKWLFITSYDYDAIAGAGLLIQAGVEAGVRIKIILVTDGAQGYAGESEKSEITDMRRKETVQSFFSLGVKDIEYLLFPDANLHYFVGRSEVGEEDDYCVINGFGGLQNAFTYHIRRFAPSHVFVCNRDEFQPEYEIIYRETLLSIFNASGKIWPELGSPLDAMPGLVEFAVFRSFQRTPTICLTAPKNTKSKKMDAIDYFKSQTRLLDLAEHLATIPAEEYFFESDCRFIDAHNYRSVFFPESQSAGNQENA